MLNPHHPGHGAAVRRHSRRTFLLQAAGLAAVPWLADGVISTASAQPSVTVGLADGIVQISATAAIHHNLPMLETIVIEYQENIVLPNADPGDLFAFTDGASSRTVTRVHTSDGPQARDDATSVPGRFAIVELERIANPNPLESGTWLPPSTAGMAVLRSGWLLKFRTDYSDVAVQQLVDATTTDGRLVRRAGPIPELGKDSVRWPEFENFSIDRVYRGASGDVHHSFYIPPGYDPGRRYPLMVQLPGYGGLLHSLDEETRGVNVFTDRSALAWTQADEDVIVLAPQLAGNSSRGGGAEQVIELVEHFLRTYAIDPTRVYGMGYSAGGQTMSQVLSTRAELFAAYLHCSSRWLGTYDDVVDHRLPVYIFMAQNDDYYGPEPAIEAHVALVSRYTAAGLDRQEIDRLVVLDMPADAYFTAQGISSFHDGGMVTADNPQIVRWMLSQRQG